MTAEEMFKKSGYEQTESNNYCLKYESVSDVSFTFWLQNKCFFATMKISPNEVATYGIGSKELIAVVQQFKELGWIESDEKQEIKQETNYEHFKDEIIEDGIWNLALVNGKPKRCHNVYCKDCEFKTSRECKKKLEGWLKQPYERSTYKLTQFEYDLIQTYSDFHESWKLSEFKQLMELKDKGYFKCIDDNTSIQDVLKNCEVIK